MKKEKITPNGIQEYSQLAQTVILTHTAVQAILEEEPTLPILMIIISPVMEITRKSQRKRNLRSPQVMKMKRIRKRSLRSLRSQRKRKKKKRKKIREQLLMIFLSLPVTVGIITLTRKTKKNLLLILTLSI